MAIGDGLAEKTVADLNQDVHSWLDDADRRIRALVRDLLSAGASALIAALEAWNKGGK